MRLLLLPPQNASVWLEIDILIDLWMHDKDNWSTSRREWSVLRGTQSDVILELFKELEMFSLEKEDWNLNTIFKCLEGCHIEEGLDEFPMAPRR